jgi:chemotaxis protein methyltransferase CheR
MNAIKKAITQDLTEIELSENTFKKFSKKMYDLAGVNLPPNPKNFSLVKNRLSKLIRQYSLSSYEELFEYLDREDKQLKSDFISALTTNKTSFFREEAHFDFFKTYLKTHFEKNQDLRVWCAAASIGAEPYTIAICLNEILTPEQLKRTRVLATDIDLQVLERSAKGVYTPAEIEDVPDQMKRAYFEHAEKDGHDWYRVKDNLAKLVQFAPFNLIQDQYKFQHGFHVVFCRNVLIYFDEPTTKKVIANLTSTLKPDGYLILGHSESGTVRNPDLKAMTRAVYQKVK